MIQLPDAAYAELLDASRAMVRAVDAQLRHQRDNFCRRMADRLASAIAAVERAEVDNAGGGR